MVLDLSPFLQEASPVLSGCMESLVLYVNNRVVALTPHTVSAVLLQGHTSPDVVEHFACGEDGCSRLR